MLTKSYTQCPKKNFPLCRALSNQSGKFFWGHCVEVPFYGLLYKKLRLTMRGNGSLRISSILVAAPVQEGTNESLKCG